MNQSDYAKGRLPVPYPMAAGVAVSHRFAMALTAPMLALAQITEIAKIPADCRVVDIVLDSDDLDTDGAPLLAFDVGILSGDFGDVDLGGARTMGAEFFAASQLGRAGGVAFPSLASAYRTANSDKERGVGIKITAAAATAAAGTLGITLTYVSGA